MNAWSDYYFLNTVQGHPKEWLKALGKWRSVCGLNGRQHTVSVRMSKCFFSSLQWLSINTSFCLCTGRGLYLRESKFPCTKACVSLTKQGEALTSIPHGHLTGSFLTLLLNSIPLVSSSHYLLCILLNSLNLRFSKDKDIMGNSVSFCLMKYQINLN